MQRTARRVGMALATLAATGLVGAAAADAATPAQSATIKNVTGAGVFTMNFTANRAAEAPQTAATGEFDARTTLGGFRLMDVGGPITCLNVRGNRMGLFYPITRAKPSLLANIASGILIYLTVDGKGNATGVEFLPVPLTKVKSCAPTAGTIIPAKGSATLTS